jgi:hypothetical protein
MVAHSCNYSTQKRLKQENHEFQKEEGKEGKKERREEGRKEGKKKGRKEERRKLHHVSFYLLLP